MEPTEHLLVLFFFLAKTNGEREHGWKDRSSDTIMCMPKHSISNAGYSTISEVAYKVGIGCFGGISQIFCSNYVSD